MNRRKILSFFGIILKIYLWLKISISKKSILKLRKDKDYNGRDNKEMNIVKIIGKYMQDTEWREICYVDSSIFMIFKNFVNVIVAWVTWIYNRQWNQGKCNRIICDTCVVELLKRNSSCVDYLLFLATMCWLF